MNQEEFRKELYALLNRAASTVCANGMANPMIDACATITVLAANSAKAPLEGMIEILRHRLDNSVGEARIAYDL